jgi:hypothetical protein
VMLQRAYTVLIDEAAQAQIDQAQTSDEKLAIVQGLVLRRLAAIKAFRGTTPTENPVADTIMEVPALELPAPSPIVEVSPFPSKPIVIAPSPVKLSLPVSQPSNQNKVSEEKRKAQEIADFEQEWTILIALAGKVGSLNAVDRVLRTADGLFVRSKSVIADAEKKYDQVREMAQKRSLAMQQPASQTPVASSRPDPTPHKQAKKFKGRYRPIAQPAARPKSTKRPDLDMTEEAESYTPPSAFRRFIKGLINLLPRGIRIFLIGAILSSHPWPHLDRLKSSA